MACKNTLLMEQKWIKPVSVAVQGKIKRVLIQA
jgi:hypothetical protein